MSVGGIGMRYMLIADVDSSIYISENVSVETNELKVEFLKNDAGKLISVTVSKPVPLDRIDNFKQSLEPGTGDVKLKISVGGDKELHDDLVRELQTIESNLAFAVGGLLKRIRWDQPKQEYIPESNEEEAFIAIRNISAKKAYPQPKANVTPDLLIGLVKFSSNYETVSLAKAFWREGVVYHDNFQYIPAFYQFYFVLEDFYISGKTSSKKAVMRKFQESRELLDIANKTLTKFQDMSEHKSKLLKFLTDYKCNNTANGLLEMLYEVRNNLHHFHSKSTREQGTPFNQSDFDTISLVAMYMVSLAIGFREAGISQSLENK